MGPIMKLVTVPPPAMGSKYPWNIAYSARLAEEVAQPRTTRIEVSPFDIRRGIRINNSSPFFASSMDD